MGLRNFLGWSIVSEFEALVNFGINNIGTKLIGILFYNIVRAILFVIQFAEDLFKALAGISSLSFDGTIYGGNGTSTDLLFAFLTDPTVQNTFFAVLGFSIVMLVIFTIIAMVKAEFTIDTKTAAKGPILARSFKAILQFFIVPVFVLIGVVASNALTKTVWAFTTGSDNASISATCFKVGAYNANRARNDAQFASFLKQGYYLDADTPNQVNPFAGNNMTQDMIANYVDALMTGIPGDSGLSSGSTSTDSVKIKKTYTLDSNTQIEGFTINELVFNVFSTDNLYKLWKDGKYSSGNNVINYGNSSGTDLSGKNWQIEDKKYYAPWQTYMNGTPKKQQNADMGMLPYRNTTLVNYFYDFKEFDFVLAIGCGAVIGWTMLTLCLGLLKRLFEMVILFLMSPAVICMAPLDGGNAYNSWKKDIYSRLVAIIGPVFGFNVFLTLLPMINKIAVFNVIGDTTLLSRSFPNALRILMDIFLQTLCLIVGTGLLKSASTMLSGYLGVKDLLTEGSDVMGKVGGAVKRATMVTAGVAAGTAMAGRAAGTVFHGTAAVVKGVGNKLGIGRGSGTEEKAKLKANKDELKSIKSQIAELAPHADDPEVMEKYRGLKAREAEIGAENAGLQDKINSGDVTKKGSAQKLEKLQNKLANDKHLSEDDKKRLKEKISKVQEKSENFAENKKLNVTDPFRAVVGYNDADGKHQNGLLNNIKDKAHEKADNFKKTAKNIFLPEDKDGRTWTVVLDRLSAGLGGKDQAGIGLLNLALTKDGRKSLYQSELEKKAADKAKEKKDKNDAAAAENDLYNKRKQAERDEREKEAEAERLRAQEEQAQRIMDLVKQFYASKNLGDNEYAEYKGLYEKRKRAMEMGDTASVDNINADIKNFETKHDIEVNADKTKQDIINNEDTQREFNAFKDALRAAAQEDAFKHMGIDDSKPVKVTNDDKEVKAKVKNSELNVKVKNTSDMAKDIGNKTANAVRTDLESIKQKIDSGEQSIVDAIKKKKN